MDQLMNGHSKLKSHAVIGDLANCNQEPLKTMLIAQNLRSKKQHQERQYNAQDTIRNLVLFVLTNYNKHSMSEH